jgi:hypothetical protein
MATAARVDRLRLRARRLVVAMCVVAVVGVAGVVALPPEAPAFVGAAVAGAVFIALDAWRRRTRKLIDRSASRRR